MFHQRGEKKPLEFSSNINLKDFTWLLLSALLERCKTVQNFTKHPVLPTLTLP